MTIKWLLTGGRFGEVGLNWRREGGFRDVGSGGICSDLIREGTIATQTKHIAVPGSFHSPLTG